MHSIIKIILIALILLIFLLLFLPSSNVYEHFNKDVINAFDRTSAVLYSQSTNDTDYLKSLNPINTELMVMNRCIEFNTGSIEPIIADLKKDFFVSEKIVIQYVDFMNIQDKLKDELVKLYANYKYDGGFLSPIYVLITQYPKYLKISPDCTKQHFYLSDHKDGNFSPININKTDCNIDSYIECEIFILMPSHSPSTSSNIVGKANGRTWNDIKDSMSVLLEPLTNKQVINTRSTNSKCFTKCGNVADKVAYACGARSGKTSGPDSYESTVINYRANNMDNGDKIVDIANLYVIDIDIMNSIICPALVSSCNRFLVNNIHVEPITSTLTSAQDDSVIGESEASQIITDTEAICYAKRYPEINLSGSAIKQHWYNIGRGNGNIKECDKDFLPITDEQLECYMYQQAYLQNRTISESDKATELQLARISYIENYKKGIIPEITCPLPMSSEQADCYMNRYNDIADTRISAIKHWNSVGFIDGKINSCDKVSGDGFYKPLTPEEAYCYKLRTASSLTDTADINKKYFSDTNPQPINRTCLPTINMTTNQRDCYINRNELDIGTDKAEQHYNEIGAYKGLSFDCENGRYNTIAPAELQCYKNNNQLQHLSDSETKQHWFNIGFVNNLNKSCLNPTCESVCAQNGDIGVDANKLNEYKSTCTACSNRIRPKPMNWSPGTDCGNTCDWDCISKMGFNYNGKNVCGAVCRNGMRSIYKHRGTYYRFGGRVIEAGNPSTGLRDKNRIRKEGNNCVRITDGANAEWDIKVLANDCSIQPDARQDSCG